MCAGYAQVTLVELRVSYRSGCDTRRKAEFTLQELHPSGRGVLPTAASNLALGCLSSTGITLVTLTQRFKVIGAHACDSCHPLKQVDLSNMKVEEIQEFTFAHCTSLREISFPPTLHTIRVKGLYELCSPVRASHTALVKVYRE